MNQTALFQLKNLITSREQLERYLSLTSQEKDCFDKLAESFRVSITPYYLSLINSNDPHDPIRRQCVPQPGELIASADLSFEDPLAEDANMPVPFLVHRYPDRVLFLLTDKCAVYCRHCTRKRWTAHDQRPTNENLEQMIKYIEDHDQIRDVLISGGDPLLGGVPRLLEVLERLSKIERLDIIRIGTRVPVVLPQLIDETLARSLGRFKPLYINTHFNHPAEVTPEAIRALGLLADQGIVLGNQTVLLAGVNDDVKVLEELFRKLLRARCKPYYLLQCDPVLGTEHLRTPVKLGVEILRQLRGRLTGLAIPKFIVDLPGGGGKVELAPDWEMRAEAENLVFKNSRGKEYRYPENSLNY